MLHHSSSAVALEIWWPGAARHLKYDDQVPYGTWNVVIKCHGTWFSYFKCRVALDHHISSAVWHLVIIFQVPRGTWSSYFKCHGTWWMMQHYYVLYTFIYKFNILFTFIFFAAKRSVAKLPTAGALAAAVLDKPKKLTQAGSCLNHV